MSRAEKFHPGSGPQNGHSPREDGIPPAALYNLNVDPEHLRGPVKRPSIPPELYSLDNVVSLFSRQQDNDTERRGRAQKKAKNPSNPLRGPEDDFWPFTQNSRRRGVVVEPTTTPREVRVVWERPKINLAELAKKRWIDGWSVEQLGNESGYKRTSIKAFLGRPRRREIETLDLGPERKAIMDAIKAECKIITKRRESHAIAKN